MGSTPEKEPMGLGSAPLNFIYSCSLCSATFADVYEGHHESVRGLSDGINPKDRLVTRLFLASCCHVFCSSHLEGGGPPFHSDKERPKAPCPVCIKEKDDSEPQFLYSIRGFNKNEYDPMIPPSWFTAPPIRLDGNGKEMDALRFQYIALIRYCQNTYATRKPLEQTLKESEKNLTNMRNLVAEEHVKMIGLQNEVEKLKAQKDQFEAMQAEVQRLQGIEQEFEELRSLNVNARDLKTFITNKSAIRHYLKLVPMLMEQNEKMQKRLAQLGFAMPMQPVPNFKGVDPSAFDSNETLARDDDRFFNGVLRKATSSHTVGGNVHASDKVGMTPSSSHLRRPGKRQRLDSPTPKDMQVDCSPGRRPMQPPAKPLSRMQSMRNIFPILRKKFTSDQSSTLADENPGVGKGVQMHKDANWQSVNTPRQEIHNEFYSEPPYMSGALPMEQKSQHLGSRSPQQRAKIGMYEHQSDFTFRASSPAKAESYSKRDHLVQLPIEPSYIRLMDGLSCEDEVDLGLKDPRDHAGLDYQSDGSNRQMGYVHENQPIPQTTHGQKFWSPRNFPMHQSPHGSSTSVETYQRPPRYRPTNASTNRLYNRPNLGRAQHSPKKYHHPGNSIESVFKSLRRLSVSKINDDNASSYLA
ncbi:hypothetical protein COCC4DRAFT_65371 [Bipolaris maydis ATCC 48331]|uniref:Uncharacterized protein n=2 Tax=Cochliobolus heterostrophus TaxID=5016 RepID=M2V9Y2_COCH5|nr:uncharacterized protein COCC4DRAFT_65371 [Bipolaris maydis ATCC 48331]EMD96513.1 hypothetical protein COCHEDRAFT_1083811 [Bipolaris maydis C5]KAJ5031595.1 hypothetical protein J3E73DRAFT_387380 [Bipolaris maydis]ENI00659.1 hypothetical protein COCC4DRAFT_65371 [Bipolaris maydis ATCC 48331]KAJ5060360.1 hypothetical protein J3E74DRAFT_406712 [Bipolaris maydis]KAJ6201807.1 hypothetical protein J3E72DRAFT_370768 [Bipolaris maydis]